MKFGRTIITKVFDVYGYDNATGKLIFTSKNLTKGGVKNSQSSEEVRNGENNALWTILYSDKTTEVTCTENTFNLDEIAMLAGTSITNDANEPIYSDEKIYTITGSDTAIELTPTPATDAKITCTLNGEVVEGTLSSGSLSVTGAKSGDVVTVYPYLINGNENVDIIKINMDDAPKSMKLVLRTTEISAGHKVLGTLEFIFPNALTTGEWQIDTTSKVQANEQEITFKILQVEGSKNIYTIHRIPISDTTGV